MNRGKTEQETKLLIAKQRKRVLFLKKRTKKLLFPVLEFTKQRKSPPPWLGEGGGF
jgi:hypothetical protein